MDVEWITEEIPLEKSILFRRVYRNRSNLIRHILTLTERGLVIVFKFKNHLPQTHEIINFLHLLEETAHELREEEKKEIRIHVVRLLYGEWSLEIVAKIVPEVAKEILVIVVEHIISKIWKQIKRAKAGIIEELEIIEEYDPSGKVKRRRKIYRRMK